MPVLERAKGRERTPAPRVALHRFVAAPTPDPGAGRSRSRSRRDGRVAGGAVRGGRPVPKSKSEEEGEEEEEEEEVEEEVEPSPGLPTISTALPPSPWTSSLLPPP
jgi:hypothetical protein